MVWTYPACFSFTHSHFSFVVMWREALSRHERRKEKRRGKKGKEGKEGKKGGKQMPDEKRRHAIQCLNPKKQNRE